MWQSISNTMKAFCLLLLVLLFVLQLQLWSSDGGLPSVWSLRQLIDRQQDENEQLAARNSALLAEVNDLRQGDEAIEERARSQLGMIRDGELFFLVVDAPKGP